jgi:hypothetical protein
MLHRKRAVSKILFGTPTACQGVLGFRLGSFTASPSGRGDGLHQSKAWSPVAHNRCAEQDCSRPRFPDYAAAGVPEVWVIEAAARWREREAPFVEPALAGAERAVRSGPALGRGDTAVVAREDHERAVGNGMAIEGVEHDADGVVEGFDHAGIHGVVLREPHPPRRRRSRRTPAAPAETLRRRGATCRRKMSHSHEP